MENAACVINAKILSHPCLTQTDVYVLIGVVVVIIAVFSINGLMQSNKADKIANQIAKNRHKREHQYDEPKK
jgi:hypothetical protein